MNSLFMILSVLVLETKAWEITFRVRQYGSVHKIKDQQIICGTPLSKPMVNKSLNLPGLSVGTDHQDVEFILPATQAFTRNLPH